MKRLIKANQVDNRHAICAHPHVHAKSWGFTLIELLVVIAITAILASLLLPVLVMAKIKAQTAQCTSNFKQMQLGSILYNSEYEDYMAPNSDAGPGSHGQDFEDPSWVAGNMTLTASSLPEFEESTNLDYLVGRQYGPFGSLGPYTKDGKIYHCPADKSLVTFNGSSADRVRSISMNGWVGFGTRDWMQPASGSAFKLNFKLGDMINPGPAQTWVFIDERENSINDGWFAVDMVDQGSSAMWIDLPAIRHNYGAVLSFADGHSEFMKWGNGTTISASLTPNTASPNNQDVLWLQQHTTGSQ